MLYIFLYFYCIPFILCIFTFYYFCKQEEDTVEGYLKNLIMALIPFINIILGIITLTAMISDLFIGSKIGKKFDNWFTNLMKKKL